MVGSSLSLLFEGYTNSYSDNSTNAPFPVKWLTATLVYRTAESHNDDDKNSILLGCDAV
jgi:hypothetical protein